MPSKSFILTEHGCNIEPLRGRNAEDSVPYENIANNHLHFHHDME